MYLILAKKEKDDKIAPIYPLVSHYLRKYGKDDFMLAYPGYASRYYYGESHFDNQKFICDKLYDIKGNSNTGLFAHFMNPQEANYMSFYLNKRNPNRYMFLDVLYDNKQDHSKMLIFFKKEAYPLFCDFYFDNRKKSFKIPSCLIKACVIGSSNQSDNTYLHHLHGRGADKGEADLFIVNDDFFGKNNQSEVSRFIKESISNFIEYEGIPNGDSVYSIFNRYTASETFDIGNGNDALEDLFNNFVVEK